MNKRAKLLYGLIYLLSLLPLWVHYLCSDVIYLLVYKVMGYRVKVVRQNLSHSFPEKTEQERRQTERLFYKWLCDYAVETICAHGSPRSKYDNRDLWKVYDYQSLGIIGEPYLDTDFSDVLYLTDTGRRWDGYKTAVRDKIPQFQDKWTAKGWTWRTTAQLMEAIEKGSTPAHIMLTTHPQRWTNDMSLWYYEWLSQTVKNLVKRIRLMSE